jgi:hypothetical protein
LEAQLKNIVDERVFENHVLEGDQALANAKLELAADHFEAAKRIWPDRDKPQQSLVAIQRFRDAKASLNAANNFLAEKKLTQAYVQAQGLRDTIPGNFGLKIEDDQRFRAIRAQLTEETASMLWQLANDLRAFAGKRKAIAEEALTKTDYPLALQEFEAALQELGKAEDSLHALKLFPLKGRSEEIEERRKETSQELAWLKSVKQKTRGLDFLQRGRDSMKQGDAHLILAKKKSVHLRKAEHAFSTALEQFGAAKDFPGTDADADLASARKARDHVAKLMQPFLLDFRNPKVLEGWSFPKEEWTLRTANPRARFQSGNVLATTLTSPLVEFPADFDLKVEFGMVNDIGTPRNGSWMFHPDFVVLTLVAKDKNSPALTISFGNDTNLKFQQLAHVAVGKKSYSLPGQDEPSLRVRLIRRQGTATLSIANKQIASFPLEKEYHQFSFRVNNERLTRKTFAAIYNASLKIYEK